jgi:hypothetical protein
LELYHAGADAQNARARRSRSRRSRPGSRRADLTQTAVNCQPRACSCRCRRRQESRPPCRSGQARRRVLDKATTPTSEVTTEPRIASFRRRSKSSLRASPSDSPAAFVIAASLNEPNLLKIAINDELYSEIRVHPASAGQNVCSHNAGESSANDRCCECGKVVREQPALWEW